MFKSLQLKHLMFFLSAMFISSIAIAQTTVKGTIYDAETKEALFGSSIIIKGTTSGAQSSFDGTFNFTTSISGNVVVTVSYIGYLMQSFDVNLSGGEKDLGKIYLESDAIGMEQLNVIATVAIDRKTPVAVSSISRDYIEQEGGSLETPELMNNTPGVYATKQGGGFGDSRINVRGFDQRNIAIMVNGIPVNDMENGWVYWSNWAGLGDALRTMQIQRGLGASKLAINSVGGTMNMVTKTTDVKAGGMASLSLTDYGNKKFIMGLSTGKFGDGWAISFVGSRTEGPGYVDQTWVDAWSYYLSVSKEWKNNLMTLTVIGAPQRHGQRTFTVGQSVFDTYGNKYNQHWGTYNGNVLMERENFYHKPQIALNDYWTISQTTNLSASLYASFGNGGGTGTLDNRDVLPRFRMQRDNNGQISWDAWAEENANHTDTAYLDNGQYTADGNLYNSDGSLEEEGGYQTSKNILRNSVNNHRWYGLLVTLNHRFNDEWNILAGIDARTYTGEHYREVRDLLGGDIFIESLDNAVEGVAGRSQIRRVGDKIAYNNDGLVSYAGFFGQGEYSNEKLSVFLAFTLSNTWYGKVDRYNFVDEGNQKAETQSAFGYNAKIGANYNLNENHNVFLNAGYYNRAPYWDFVFVNNNEGSLDPVQEILNETITAFEVGYGWRNSWIGLNLGAYYTLWGDKSLTDNFTDGNGDDFTASVSGLNATHTGVELDFEIKATDWLSVLGVASYGDWKWTNNVSAPVFDDFGNQIAVVDVKAEGVEVGNQPQSQYIGGLKFNILPSLFVNFNYRYNDRLYRGYDVVALDDDFEIEKLDSYGLFDVHAGFDFNISELDAYAGMNIYNVFDTVTQQEGDSFGYFWTFGRTFNFTLRVNF